MQINRELLRRPRGALEAYVPARLLPSIIDPCAIGQPLIANMLAAWLDGEPQGLSTGGQLDEPQDRRNITGANRPTFTYPVDAGQGAPASGSTDTSMR